MAPNGSADVGVPVSPIHAAPPVAPAYAAPTGPSAHKHAPVGSVEPHPRGGMADVFPRVAGDVPPAYAAVSHSGAPRLAGAGAGAGGAPAPAPTGVAGGHSTGGGVGSGPEEPVRSPVGPSGGWSCDTCTFKNAPGAVRCTMCNAEPAFASSLTSTCATCYKKKSRDNWMTCGHWSCVACLTQLISTAIEEGRCARLRCPTPGCSRLLSEEQAELNSCMGRDVVEPFMEAVSTEMLASDGSMTSCVKCGDTVSFDKDAAVDVPDVITEKDESDKVLSREAFVHFNRFRLRCRKCDTEYCASCKATPYHKGYTCEAFAEYGASRHCRFCEAAITPADVAPGAPSPALADVCRDEECVEKRDACCTRMKACGHPCGGVRGESKDECLPCIHEDCYEANGEEVNADDYCGICYSEGLGAAPSIKLACGHIFHKACVQTQIESKWNGVKISFGFLDCPSCRRRIDHPSVNGLIAPHLRMYDAIREKAMRRLKMEGMDKDERLTKPDSDYYQQPERYALHSFAFYSCFKCHKPYFGGRRNCDDARNADNTPPEELVCYDCSDMRAPACSNSSHKEFWLWKCKFCCSPAVWFCWGNTHFCEPCHQKAGGLEKLRREGKQAKFKTLNKQPRCSGKVAEDCNLRIKHAPQGEEVCLGCGACQEELEAKRSASRVDMGGSSAAGGAGAGDGRGAARRSSWRPKRAARGRRKPSPARRRKKGRADA